jgi:hypothetical protein
MYRDPSSEDIEQNEFKAIWGVIKDWDINVSGEYKGYCSATGNHVMAIMDSLKEMRDKQEVIMGEVSQKVIDCMTAEECNFIQSLTIETPLGCKEATRLVEFIKKRGDLNEAMIIYLKYGFSVLLNYRDKLTGIEYKKIKDIWIPHISYRGTRV